MIGPRPRLTSHDGLQGLPPTDPSEAVAGTGWPPSWHPCGARTRRKRSALIRGRSLHGAVACDDSARNRGPGGRDPAWCGPAEHTFDDLGEGGRARRGAEGALHLAQGTRGHGGAQAGLGQGFLDGLAHLVDVPDREEAPVAKVRHHLARGDRAKEPRSAENHVHVEAPRVTRPSFPHRPRYRCPSRTSSLRRPGTVLRSPLPRACPTAPAASSQACIRTIPGPSAARASGLSR